MRAALAVLLPLAIAACADPLARCTAPAGREIERLDLLVAESEATLARGYRLEAAGRPGPVVGFCAGRDAVSVCASRDLTPEPRPVAIDPAAERERLALLRTRREVAQARAEALARACAGAR